MYTCILLLPRQLCQCCLLSTSPSSVMSYSIPLDSVNVCLTHTFSLLPVPPYQSFPQVQQGGLSAPLRPVVGQKHAELPEEGEWRAAEEGGTGWCAGCDRVRRVCLRCHYCLTAAMFKVHAPQRYVGKCHWLTSWSLIVNGAVIPRRVLAGDRPASLCNRIRTHCRRCVCLAYIVL